MTFTEFPLGLPGRIFGSPMPFGVHDKDGSLFHELKTQNISVVVVLAEVGLEEGVREGGVEMGSADEHGHGQIDHGIRSVEQVVQEQWKRNEQGAADQEEEVPVPAAQPDIGRGRDPLFPRHGHGRHEMTSQRNSRNPECDFELRRITHRCLPTGFAGCRGGV